MKKLSLVSSSVILLMVLSVCGSKMVGKVEEASMMIPAPVISIMTRTILKIFSP